MKEISRRDVVAAGAGMLPFLGLAGYALGQAENRAGARPAGSATGMDAGIAACLLVKGRRQVEACRFAVDKLQHDECKKLAQAEIDEHENIKKRLSEIGFEYPTVAGRSGVATVGATDGDDRQRGRMVTVGRTALPPGVSDMIALDLELLDQCLTTYKSEMGKIQGTKFDKAFTGDQLHAHYALWDHATVFRKHASGNLAQILDEGKPVIERHIAMCKQAMEKLDAMKRDGE